MTDQDTHRRHASIPFCSLLFSSVASISPPPLLPSLPAHHESSKLERITKSHITHYFANCTVNDNLSVAVSNTALTVTTKSNSKRPSLNTNGRPGDWQIEAIQPIHCPGRRSVTLLANTNTQDDVPSIMRWVGILPSLRGSREVIADIRETRNEDLGYILLL